MNLVLIGYRGTGKSTLADRLHEELHLPVYHMDELLEERFGEKIASYVEKHGWDSFREEEQCLTEELSAMDAVIIDCGGGVVTREINIANLKKNGFVVWLQTSPDRIAERIGLDTNRPSLTGNQSHTDEIRHVLQERIPLYQSASDIIVQTDENSLEDCVSMIVDAWKNVQ
jgi:shikimate kinase